jgi:putative ATP-dependent endonuclease of OLD family
VRISSLRLHDFRGWADLVVRPQAHVLLAGVPRAGRSDVIAALSRLLDPALIRVQPSLTDLRRESRTTSEPTSGNGVTAAAQPKSDTVSDSATSSPIDGVNAVDESEVAAFAEVEATLVELDQELEQLCDGFLEPLDSEGQVDESGNAAPDAPFGVRLSYRVTYDRDADVLEHVVYYPVRSNPVTAQYARVPASVRRALPIVFLSGKRPLQLRAEGLLRRLVTERDPDMTSAALRTLEQSVSTATDSLTSNQAIAATINGVLQAGGLAQHLTDTPLTAAQVRFRAEDGSLSALLRAIQPVLDLDDAGLLPLPNHGSTATSVLASAEALVLASSEEHAVVIGDDFGDDLDAPTAEHLAATMRASAAQVWLATRRPEVARAFAPSELIRLARHGGNRSQHVLAAPVDKKEVAVRRLIHTQLLPALTAPVVAIVEGPHDLTTYTSADRHMATTKLPLAAVGVRLISADHGSGGGTGQIPRVAELAHAMGFRVVALIDRDPDKTSTAVLAQIETACDVVIRLPPGTAIEKALQTNVGIHHLRAAAAILPAYGIPDPAIGKSDTEVALAIAQVLHKKGLHEQFLDAVIAELKHVPPLLVAALDAVTSAAAASYNGPSRIDLTNPAATTSTT